MAGKPRRTLVYAPEVRVLTYGRDGVTRDLSKDVVRGSVTRRVNSVSSASLTLNNKRNRYTAKLSRMDRIVIFLKRAKWDLVFSGYLTQVPALDVYPATCEIRAQCTLKRLMHTYWDPGLPDSADLLIANNEKGLDGGSRELLVSLLSKVGAWSANQIHVQQIPRAFAELAHAFGNDWSLRAAFNHQDKDQDSELFYVYGTPDRDTGLGLFAYPSAYAGSTRSRHVDVRASGPLAFGGRRHDAVVGASWADSRVREISWYGNDVGTPLGPGGAFDGRYPKPAFDSDSDGSDFEFRRDALYANVRWDLADTFKLITGANHARVRMAGTGYGTPKDSEVTRTTPFVGAVWDIAAAYSLYASYGGIFAQQTELDASGAPLEAIEGSNLEAGLKGAWLDGRLNASAAVFRVEQDNLARYVGFDVDSGRSVYAGEDARSTGIELEVAGDIGEVWSLSAGWTRLRIEDDAGDDSRPYVPRTTLRAAAVARVDAVPGLRVGGSVRWQGDIWQPVVLPDGAPARVEQTAYAVVGLMAGYRLRSGWDATLNLDNVTDRRYITSLYSAGQGFYAAPRSVSLTLGYRF